VAEDEDFRGQLKAGYRENDVGLENQDEDSGSFLSPADVQDLLESLEDADKRLLGGAKTAEKSAESVDAAQQEAIEKVVVDNKKNAQDLAQSELLSRIATEVRSIKMELAGIKQQYEERLAKFESAPEFEQEDVIDSDWGRTGSGIAVNARPTPDIDSISDAAIAEKGRYIQEATFVDIKRLLGYLDTLLEALPEEKIDEFARSEYFDLYRRIFEFFGLA
jgi:hypothetical protein